MVSTWQPWHWYKTFPRQYFVELELVSTLDPFDCWKTTWRSAQRSLASLHPAARRPLLPSRISCCHISAEFRPKCFGVVQQTKQSASEPQHYVWYHPNNCCGSQPLLANVQRHIRCELPRQKAWRVAIAQASFDSSRCCRPGTRKPFECSSGRWLRARLSRSSACPAGAALLQTSCKITRKALQRTDHAQVTLRDVGHHDKHCSIYGHDGAACCLVQVCKTDISGLRCLACLLAEVPWGFWSRSQRLLLVRLLHQLPTESTASPRPAFTFTNSLHVHNTFHEVLDAGQDVPAKEPAGVSAPRLLPMLMIISAVLSLTGQHHLYSALHSLQVAAPLHILSPQDLAKVLQALATAPLQLTFGSRGATQTHIPDEALCSGRPQARLAASVAPVPACGLAVATFISFYQKRSPNELPDSCCPAHGWPSLVRAASEGGHLSRWPTAAFALCLLCELSKHLDAGRVMVLDRMVDHYLSCPERVICPWQERTCGYELWTPVLCGIRASMPHSRTNRTTPEPVPTRRREAKSHTETMRHLIAGGSLMRFNDGEQLQLNSEVNGPLARYTDTFIRLSFSVQARCPGLCVGIIHPDDNSTLAALGQTHLDWWQTSGLPNTRALFRSGLLPDQSCLAARTVWLLTAGFYC